MKPHRHPLVRRARRRLEIVRRTGRWRPDHLRLAGSGHLIHVDPSDPRGWEIVRGLGRGHQPALMALWGRAVEVVAPNVALDVGANYGEVVLSARYPPGARVWAFEPNPTVADCLRRSVAGHPDSSALTVVEAMASDAPGRRDLWVDPAWSGSASAARPVGGARSVAVDVTTVDAVAADVATADRVVLKVDAEGWEAQVLAGAAHLIDGASQVVAIVEFEPAHLRRAGTDPETVVERLATVGPCWAMGHDGTLERLGTVPSQACDLVCVSDPTTAGALGAR